MKSVQILLSTYNGEKYLDQQIESLVKQEDVNVSILARDDGSSDNTVQILEKWATKARLCYYVGNNIKPAYSFMDLIHRASGADYYAFCDQDDVWDSNKLITAIDKISQNDLNLPLLYYSQLFPVDKDMNPVKYKQTKVKNSLGRVMIVSFAAGCTMVFNESLLKLAKLYSPRNIRMHDQWVFLLCLSCGGRIFYDNNPHIKYRQHQNNTVGFHISLEKRMLMLWNSFMHGGRERSAQVEELYNAYSCLIPEEETKLLKRVINYRSSVKNKMILLLDSEIKAGSIFKNLIFEIAVIFNRL
jgi:rhamnosyltransferase